MNTIVFLATPGKIQRMAYSYLYDLWNDHKITCIYKHINKRCYKRFPNEYDLGISFLYTHKIPKAEIEKAPWINFHPGPLPEYGGRNIAYQAIIDNAENFGATLHYMTENFDEGPIIAVKRFLIKPHHTAGDLIERSHELLLQLFYKYVPKIINGYKLKTKNHNVIYHKKESINDFIDLSETEKNKIRALTCGQFCAKIQIDKKMYRIVPE